MQNKWIGLLYYVCNDYDWFGGSCDYGDLFEDYFFLWFDWRFKDFEVF